MDGPSESERTWSSHIGDWGEYWDDVMDVHGHWWNAVEDPENAEYTLEELEETRFEVPNFIDWLIWLQEEGLKIVDMNIWRGLALDPSVEPGTGVPNEVEITRITVKLVENKGE
tara:strand:- start:4 stop:345 length:342 start_codon:yes stop_codon:yes gene_type:complete